MSDLVMEIQTWALSAPVIATAVFLTGCKDEQQTRKIKELEEQAAGHVSEIENLGSKLQEAENESNKLRGDFAQAQQDAANAKQQAEQLQKQIEAMRKAEEAAREAARSSAQRNPVEDSRKAVQERLPAIWLIEGDQGTCRGIAAEADGKTWLYFPATSLKGSAKLAVKNASGTTVTKFGEFQVAADANLARLEIKQDAPVRLKVEAKTGLGENPRLLTASTAADGGAVMLDETQAGNISDADIEISSYNSSAVHGFPIFNAETGALIAITVPEHSSLTGLWETSRADASGMSHAARLDRTIEWKPSNMGALLTERRKIDELLRLTRLIDAVALLRPTASGLNMQAIVGGGGLSVRQILEQNNTMPGAPDLIKLDETLAAQKVRISEADIRRQFSGFVGSFSNAGHRAAADLKTVKPSPCYKTDAENALKWNEEAEKKLQENLSSGGR
jgi:hypothetical protein